MKDNTLNGYFNWKGEWIPGESPFDRARDYSLKQDLVKEILETTKKYEGRINNKVIAEAALEVSRKYEAQK